VRGASGSLQIACRPDSRGVMRISFYSFLLFSRRIASRGVMVFHGNMWTEMDLHGRQDSHVWLVALCFTARVYPRDDWHWKFAVARQKRASLSTLKEYTR
jgi:hypothetical protein